MKQGKKQKKILKEWKEVLYSIFFPRHCPICDETIAYGYKICPACEKKIPYIKEPVCKKCGKQLENERQEYCGDCSRKKHYFLQGKAVFSYRKEMKLSMYRFKYSNKREYADYYAEVAVCEYGIWIKRKGIEVIVPVPMFLDKKRQRGYNQAEIFAQALSREMGIPVEKRLIRRVRNTAPQKSLNDRERKDNLKNAFQVDRNIVKYRKILLVDDIYTTGTTVDAIAENLQKVGVTEIYVLNICIGDGY
ncbi:MAG: ComF family protein [Roseburia sp.]|nr:ComF family protein [Roseburia sp.]